MIIYLPRGGLSTTSEPDLLSSIALSSNATVVRLNYRLSAQHPYPTPVHDVLAGYDRIKHHLGKGTTSPGDSLKVNQASRLGVCGEFIGGSLAAMLALTECQAQGQSISAAALGNPVSDWTALFPADQNKDAKDPTSSRYHATKDPKASTAGPRDGQTTDSLLRLRDKIFPQPAKFFDPFASPSLFFRTPSIDLPPTVNPLLVEPSSSEAEMPDEPLVRKRRSHRTHPPLNSNLRIPRIRVEIGMENVLHDQGIELWQLIRRSVILRQRTERSLEEGEADGGDQIEFLKRDGAGLWGEKEAGDIGRWFAEVLC